MAPLLIGETALGADSACNDEVPYYSGAITLPPDVYDVYVKLGRVGQSATISSYVQAGDQHTCSAIGTAVVTGDAWSNIGVYQARQADPEAHFRLSSTILSQLPDANRPSLLLVSRTKPACIPTIECETMIDGAKAFIRPSSNNLATNDLRITVAKDVNDDNVTQVLYYVDNELMYQTETLEPFNMQAVPYYGTVMTRVVEYASGQTAVLQTEVPSDHADNLWAMLAREIGKNANTLLLAAIILGTLLTIRLTQLLIYYQRKRYYWRVWHGFIKEKLPSHPLLESINWHGHWRLLRGIFITLEMIAVGTTLVVALVLVINAYVGQIATVRGDSMDATYKNGQKVVVNKIPVMMARINHRYFIPMRGEVVAIRPSYGTSVDDAEKNSEVIIKRVIGLPGDKVVVSKGVITIFNVAHPDGFNPATNTSWAKSILQEDGAVDDITTILTENELFIVGDNREVSIDSRFNGPVSASQLIGVVEG